MLSTVISDATVLRLIHHMFCQVLGEAEEDSRLLLCEATAVIMRQCFQLLGIKPLYRI